MSAELKRILPRPPSHIASARRVAAAQGGYYDLAVTCKNEPRIEMVARLLRSLLALGKITSGGTPIDVDGFRLRDLDHWRGSSAGDPDEILCLLSRPCNASCEFCYVHGNPDDLVVRFNASESEENRREIDLRIRDFLAGRRLFLPTFDTEEIIINPHFMRAARAIRQRSNVRMYILTNGYILRPAVLEQLRDLEPIELSISLNAIDPVVRAQLMGGPTSTPLACLRELDMRGMRYDVSLVAWPSVSLEEMVRTIRFADAHQPYAIYVHLPGHTRRFSAVPLFDRERYWDEVITALAPLRADLRTPLIFTPRLYEEERLARRFGVDLGEALIVGTTPGSAAARANLECGDVVLRIGSKPIITRAQAIAALTRLRALGVSQVELTIARGASTETVVLDGAAADREGYRFHPPYRDAFGIHFVAGGISFAAIRRLFQIVRAERAHRVLLVSAPLVKPLADAMIKEFAPLLGEEHAIETVAADNEYFGGNICIGELLVADDIVRCIQRETARKSFDLAVVPSPAFRVGGWYRDLRGVPFADIGRRVSVKVRLLECDSFE